MRMVYCVVSCFLILITCSSYKDLFKSNSAPISVFLTVSCWLFVCSSPGEGLTVTYKRTVLVQLKTATGRKRLALAVSTNILPRFIVRFYSSALLNCFLWNSPSCKRSLSSSSLIFLSTLFEKLSTAYFELI